MFVCQQRGDGQLFSKACPLFSPSRNAECLQTRRKEKQPPTANLLGKLKRLVRGERRDALAEDKPSVGLYDMPHAVMIRIVANLSTHDQVSLRDTCTNFRNMSMTRYHALHCRTICNMTQLWKMSVIFPHFWVCDCCFRLHSGDQTDTPRSPRRPICTQPHLDASKESAVSDTYPYILAYRHVQLYLKWVRMGASGRYTESLLQRHKTSYALKNCRMACNVETVFHPLPLKRRVVLHRYWYFRPAQTTEPAPYWDMEICPHQRYSQSTFEAFKREDWQASQQASGPSFKVLSPQRHEYALCKALQMALANPNIGTFGACTRCPTDFSITVYTRPLSETMLPLETQGTGVRRVLLKTWQDMGGECPPLCPTWSSHSHLLYKLVLPSDFVYDEPGSAWGLYEEECKRLLKRTESLLAQNRCIAVMYRRMAQRGQRHYPDAFQVRDDKGALKKCK